MKHKHKSIALASLACLFAGGEGIISSGIELPGWNVIPGVIRAVIIMGVMAGSYYFKRQQDNDDSRR